METGTDARSVRALSRYTLEQMVALSSDGMLLADAQHSNLIVVYANPAYEELSGYAAHELAGSGWRLLERNGEARSELTKLKAAIGRAEPCEVTVPDLRKDGTPWVSHVSVRPLNSARGSLEYFLCIQRPVLAASGEHANVEVSLLQRELGRAQQKIANLDHIDSASGLLRLGYFQELLRRDLAIARRDQRYVTLLLFEIVELDAYRQTFGAKAADSCQRMIGAQIMRMLRRAGDLCARYDDSTLVAAALGQESDDLHRLANLIAENVRRLALHNPKAKSGRYITLRHSIISCPPGIDDSAEAVIARAQVRLRSEANAGESRVARSERL